LERDEKRNGLNNSNFHDTWKIYGLNSSQWRTDRLINSNNRMKKQHTKSSDLTRNISRIIKYLCRKSNYNWV